MRTYETWMDICICVHAYTRMHTYMCKYDCDDSGDDDVEKCILHTCTHKSCYKSAPRSIRRRARPMAHIKEETDDAVDAGWLPAINDPYIPASPKPTEVDEHSSPELEVGLHMVDAGLSLVNPTKEEEKVGETSSMEIPKTEEGEEVGRYMVEEKEEEVPKTEEEEEVGWYMAAMESELAQARVDEPKDPKTEEEEEVGPLLAVKDELEIDEPKITLPAAIPKLKKKKKKRVERNEELGLERVDESVIPKEEKKEELGPMEEPIDPHAAAPARSMHQVPHCSAHGVDQGVDASQPAGSTSSSYKIDAPSSSAHGVDQGIDASQPTGSKSSSHEVDTPSFTADEVTKIDAEEFDTWDPDLKRAAAIGGLAPNQSWRVKGGAGWRSKRGGSGPGSQKWKHARGTDWWRNDSW